MGIRQNILASTTARDRYLEGVSALDAMESGITAAQAYQFLRSIDPNIRMAGIEQPLSYYDLFVLWHAVSMGINTGGGGRNAAHGGPIFLPWHRHYMILLEQWIQIVLDDADFGLPYWDWAADGELPTAQQWTTELWTPEYLGEARNEVESGPLGEMRVRLFSDFNGTLQSISPRRIRRDAGRDFRFRSLPDQTDVTLALDEPAYDQSPWSAGSPGGHRNRVEGWIAGPQLHNLVHVWIGGDMSPATSPNDPVFFLNHCNVDRIWEAWMAHHGRTYEPGPGQGPQGHRLDSAMFTILGETRTPQQVLDPSEWYDYDSLTVD